MKQQVRYLLWTKNGHYFALASDGTILFDSERSYRSNSGQWRVIGIGKRFHSHQLISLDDASRGADIGQGWVHDYDHGTYRVWSHPPSRHAVKVAPASNDYRIPEVRQ